METDRAGGDNENKDGEASTSTSSRKQCSGVRMNWETDDRESESKAEQESPPIFTLTAVNSYGSADSGVRLENNGKPLKLTSQCFLRILFKMFMKSLFFHDYLKQTFLVWDLNCFIWLIMNITVIIKLQERLSDHFICTLV